MVKNFGGKKTKCIARKSIVNKSSNNILRLSMNEFEKYAEVEKLLGNGMCHVKCDDNVTRLCHIRGKFRGRGKRDNFVKTGSLLLIGIREYETIGDGKKLDNCDLLEVYGDNDMDKLKQTNTNINWNIFSKSYGTKEQTDDLHFIDNGQDEYYEMMNNSINRTNNTISNIAFDDDEEINVDDI